MLFITIIIITLVVGYIASLAKRRFSIGVYMLAAFLGASVGAGLSVGDSALFLQYPFLNIWTVPAIFSALFSFVAVFADKGRVAQTFLSILVILFVIAGLIYEDSSPSDYSGLFAEELSRAGVERVGQPIEGFSAPIYLEAFPGLIAEDFDGAESLEGVYSFDGTELVYTHTAGNTVTSAEETISSEGYKTLLSTLSERFNIKVVSEADIAVLLEKIREGDTAVGSYISDDFSIWHPEGWYPYENGTGVFFVHDANLEIPQNTDGFALGTYFQVTVHEISVEEMFAQNLWTGGSEFLVSRDDVRIGTDEAIRVVTKAAGAGGEVLHYVFEATDGRIFTLSHYPYERGSGDTDDFERAVQTFMINYVIDGNVNGNGSTGILPFDSGVTGRVLLGPICPVMREPPDPNCADKPYPTTVQVIAIGSPKSSTFATVETDKEGNYKVILPPGEYSIQAIGGQPFPRCSASAVTVEPDTMHELDLSCDTGIR